MRWTAATAPKYHVDLAKLGDLSYGIYVFHFPIIQLFLQLHLFEGSWISLFVAVLATTFVVALLSWRLIERPALALRRHWLSRPAPAPSTQAPAPAAPPLDHATSAVARGRADAAHRRGFRAPSRPWAILPRARPARSR